MLEEKNYYQLLEIDKNATQEQINKKFKRIAIVNHPDKIDKNLPEEEIKRIEELFKKQTVAYEVLSDPEERKKYDEKLKTASIKLNTEETEKERAERLLTPKPRLTSLKLPYSFSYRQDHAKYASTFKKSPLHKLDVSSLLRFYECDIYQDQADINICQNIFTLVKLKKDQPAKPLQQDWSKLTPPVAFQLFLKFLKGEIFGKNLHIAIDFFDQALLSTKDEYEKKLYEGIKDILVLGVVQLEIDDTLIQAIRKITDYAKHQALSDQSMVYMAPTFQSIYFRHLFSLGLHLYWLAKHDITSNENLAVFNGVAKTEKLFKKLKDELFDEKGKSEAIRLVNMLHMLEQDIQRGILEDDSDNNNSNSNNNNEQSLAHIYRERGFLLLDWFPALGALVPFRLIANTLLQAGIFFQKAAQAEQDPAIQMADERIALRCYLLVFQLGREDKPDSELYSLIHGLKYILQFKYADVELEEIVKAFQHKALFIANMFPFYQHVQPNIDLFTQEDDMVVLMRKLLHSLLHVMEYNQKPENKNNKIELDHEHLDILQQAYDAILGSWFRKKYDPEEEKAYRLKVMLELLRVNRWSFVNIKANLHSPGVNVKRDKEGWLVLDKEPSLSLPPDQSNGFYSTIAGVEINEKTGQIYFSFKPASKDYFSRLISLSNIQELLKEQVTAALLSLDQPNPDRPYEPFQKMRIKPQRIYGSQLQYAMLAADLLLKYFTAGYHIKEEEPFDIKPIDDLIKRLPGPLKKPITDYRANKVRVRHEVVHRFWIQAEKMQYDINEDGSKIAFGDMRMVVYKSIMFRDKNGNLVDAVNDEGWHMYVLNDKQLKDRIKYIENRSMIWTGPNTVRFFEDGRLSKEFTVKNYGQQIKELMNLSRDVNQKIIRKDIDAIELMYRVTRIVAKQANREHYFTAEEILARELTIHYNEYAHYFPILGRLRELSKAVSVVNVLGNRRLQNEELIRALLNKITEKDKGFWQKIEIELQPELEKKIGEIFADWGRTLSKPKIISHQEEKLEKLQKHLRNWNPMTQLPQIQEKFNSRVRSAGFSIYSYEAKSAWDKQCAIIAEASRNARENYLNQLRDLLKETFEPSINYDCMLNQLLDGNPSWLREHLIAYNEKIAKQKMHESFPDSSEQTLWDAVNGNSYALGEVVSIELRKQKDKIKDDLQAQRERLIKVNNTLNKLGLTGQDNDIDLEGVCLLVPACIHKDIEEHYVIVGGVQIAANLSRVSQQGIMAQQAFNNLSSVHQVQLNQRTGNMFRDQMARNLEAMGLGVLKEVRFNTPFGARYQDLVVFNKQTGEILGNIETKTGNSRYTSSQQAKDTWIRMTQGITTTVVRNK